MSFCLFFIFFFAPTTHGHDFCLCLGTACKCLGIGEEGGGREGVKEREKVGRGEWGEEEKKGEGGALPQGPAEGEVGLCSGDGKLVIGIERW